MPDTRGLYLHPPMSAALTAPSTAASATRDATERYLDRLRDHQQRYLEAAGAAAAEVRGVPQLESLAASTLQLSRQFFDAQRAIVGRVGRHQADLLDCNAGDDLLDLAAWDAGAATRQLAALLDGWWAALNSSAGKAIDEAAARRALVQQVDRIEQAHAAASTAHASRDTSPSNLPLAVRSLLEQSDGSDLRSLLRHLGAVLETHVRPIGEAVAGAVAPPVMPLLAAGPALAPAAFPPPTVPSPRVAAPAPTATAVAHPAAVPDRDLRIRETVGAAAHDEPLTRLERLEQDRRRFWSEADEAAGRDGGSWFPTPAVVSIAAATAALTAAMALIG